MSNECQTKAAVDAAGQGPSNDHVREIVGKTVVEFNLAIDALRALACLLRLAEADEENYHMYSPGCISVMLEAMTEAVDNSVDPLKMLRAEFLSAERKKS